MHARRPARLLAAATLPLVLALSACGGDDDDIVDGAPTSPSASAPAPASTPTETSTPAAPTQAPAPSSPAASAPGGSGGDDAALAAAQTATQQVAGTVVTVDTDRGGWEVVVAAADGSETEVGLDAAGTAITRGPQPEDDEDAEDRAETQRAVQAARVSWQEALTTARGVVADTPLDSVDLTEDDGRTTWEVQFGDGPGEQTVVVDAGSGEVLGTERDD